MNELEIFENLKEPLLEILHKSHEPILKGLENVNKGLDSFVNPETVENVEVFSETLQNTDVLDLLNVLVEEVVRSRILGTWQFVFLILIFVLLIVIIFSIFMKELNN